MNVIFVHFMAFCEFYGILRISRGLEHVFKGTSIYDTEMVVNIFN